MKLFEAISSQYWEIDNNEYIALYKEDRCKFTDEDCKIINGTCLSRGILPRVDNDKLFIYFDNRPNLDGFVYKLEYGYFMVNLYKKGLRNRHVGPNIAYKCRSMEGLQALLHNKLSI